jgi:hypothetical protein
MLRDEDMERVRRLAKFRIQFELFFLRIDPHQ